MTSGVLTAGLGKTECGSQPDLPDFSILSGNVAPSFVSGTAQAMRIDPL